MPILVDHINPAAFCELNQINALQQNNNYSSRHHETQRSVA
jgi:hypothetical protein